MEVTFRTDGQSILKENVKKLYCSNSSTRVTEMEEG